MSQTISRKVTFNVVWEKPEFGISVKKEMSPEEIRALYRAVMSFGESLGKEIGDFKEVVRKRSSTVEVSEEIKNRAIEFARLQTKPFTREDVQTAIGTSPKYASVACRALYDDGVFERRRFGHGRGGRNYLYTFVKPAEKESTESVIVSEVGSQESQDRKKKSIAEGKAKLESVK